MGEDSGRGGAAAAVTLLVGAVMPAARQPRPPFAMGVFAQKDQNEDYKNGTSNRGCYDKFRHLFLSDRSKPPTHGGVHRDHDGGLVDEKHFGGPVDFPAAVLSIALDQNLRLAYDGNPTSERVGPFRNQAVSAADLRSMGLTAGIPRDQQKIHSRRPPLAHRYPNPKPQMRKTLCIDDGNSLRPFFASF